MKKAEEKKLKAIARAYGMADRGAKKKSNRSSDTELKTRKRAAKEACHAFIRERDKNKLCICCNEPLGSDFHAGHFLESGNNPRIRYDELNIHGQRACCNTYKGGDSGDYERNLRRRIGDKEVDRLKSLKGGTLKRTPQDYKDIENYYKAKIKQLVTGPKN